MDGGLRITESVFAIDGIYIQEYYTSPVQPFVPDRRRKIGITVTNSFIISIYWPAVV